MASVGLRDLFAAEATENPDSTLTYAKPVRLAKAIKADISVKPAEATNYADDGIDDYESEIIGGEIKLKINDLTPEAQSFILGQRRDANGVLIANSKDKPPLLAVGMRARKTKIKGLYRYLWFRKVKFTPPAESFETRGESINFQNPEITGKFMPLDNGDWKSDYTAVEDDPVAAAWFDEVYVPVEEPEIEPETGGEPEIEPETGGEEETP